MTGYSVFCNDDLVVMNDHTVVPTMADAKARVALHAGMQTYARWARKDPSVKLFPFPPFPDDEDWPWENHPDGSVVILVWDWYYVIRSQHV